MSAANQNELETISIYNADGQALAINARRLEIVNNWLMPLEAPYVEHELAQHQLRSMIKWAQQVVVPKGASGELILNISEASIKQEDLPPSEGFFNSFKDNQDTQIRVTLNAQLLWIQPVGNYQVQPNSQPKHHKRSQNQPHLLII